MFNKVNQTKSFYWIMFGIFMSKTLCFVMIATAIVSLSSCRGDDEEDNNGGTTPTPTVVTQTYTVNEVSFKMVAVKAGSFTMGDTIYNEDYLYDWCLPEHQVTLTNDYLIGETEVTQELWQAVMGQSLREWQDSIGTNWYYGEGANYPMYMISWNDIQVFIEKLNQLTGKTFRLPTEAEWEFAARGGNQSHNYLYSGSNDIDAVAWYVDNSNQTSHPVKTKAANELGLYDMSGNVYEWVNDWWSDYTSDAQTNPQGSTTGSRRVFRGGIWGYYASGCRVAYRSNHTPDYCSSGIGFRLACSSN
ncbi:MAG: formylglycine-generating enzyme family protein [Bacteroidales bacterium]|jgi:formylglycine-generating enzyme required for sulfatase activity|nr:formylglycine-generating enzyme family protein [Bacteroidales bacterium]